MGAGASSEFLLSAFRSQLESCHIDFQSSSAAAGGSASLSVVSLTSTRSEFRARHGGSFFPGRLPDDCTVHVSSPVGLQDIFCIVGEIAQGELSVHKEG